VAENWHVLRIKPNRNRGDLLLTREGPVGGHKAIFDQRSPGEQGVKILLTLIEKRMRIEVPAGYLQNRTGLKKQVGSSQNRAARRSAHRYGCELWKQSPACEPGRGQL
jgi:hypothetical protein